MSKTIIVLLSLICALSAFQIFQKSATKEVKAINWPFTPCGTGDWSIDKLTLSAQPARNTNDDIDVVLFLRYRLEQLKLILPFQQLH